jgi:16S rRNA (guanine527-N7)-methyltransferase
MFTLADANEKRIGFVRRMVHELALANVEVVLSRIEDFSGNRDKRNRYELCISRAMAHPYVVVELGAGLVGKGGLLYIYHDRTTRDLDDHVRANARKSGLDPVDGKDYAALGFNERGFLFCKNRETPDSVPRKYPRIVKELEKLYPERQTSVR